MPPTPGLATPRRFAKGAMAAVARRLSSVGRSSPNECSTWGMARPRPRSRPPSRRIRGSGGRAASRGGADRGSRASAPSGRRRTGPGLRAGPSPTAAHPRRPGVCAANRRRASGMSSPAGKASNPTPADMVDERGVGRERHPVAGGLERLGQGDHRVEVADADHAREQDSHAMRLLLSRPGCPARVLAGSDGPGASFEVDRAVGLRGDGSAELLSDGVAM